LLQLFQQEPSHVPAVPVSSGSQQATASPSGGYSQSAPDSTSAENLNTLDEPVWHTIKRDLIRIYGNLILVVFPFKNRDQQSAALRNWDLWGPMVCMRPNCLCWKHLKKQKSCLMCQPTLARRCLPSRWQFACLLVLRSQAASFQ